jgi:hypothetical protein
MPDLRMPRRRNIKRQSETDAYLLGVAMPHEIHYCWTVQRKDLADMNTWSGQP